METRAGIKLTKKQIKNINGLKKLLKDWDDNLCFYAIAGKLHIMLKGGTKQNPISEYSDTGGFNPQNDIVNFISGKPFADGGDW